MSRFPRFYLCLLTLSLLSPVAILASDAAFDFSVRPGTDAYQALPSKTDRVMALRIPDHWLSRLSTERLVELTLDYPFLIDLFAFQDLQLGLETKAMEWNGLRVLLTRPDAASELLRGYTRVDLRRAAMAKSALTTAPSVEIKAALFERLLLHPAIFEPLVVRQPRALAAALTNKLEARLDEAGLYGSGPIARRALRRVLDEGALEKADRLAFASRTLLDDNIAASALTKTGCGSNYNARVYTPRCTEVCAIEPDSEWPNANYLTSLYVNAYSGIATLTDPVSKRYLCHTWAFHMTEYTTYPTHEVDGTDCPGFNEGEGHPEKVQIFVIDVKNSYLADGSYTEVFDISQATKAVYATKAADADALTGTANIFDHSGTLSSGCPGGPNNGVASDIRNVCLESKWGYSGPRMKHKPGNDPYTVSSDPNYTNPAYTSEGTESTYGQQQANQLDLRLYKRTGTGTDTGTGSQSIEASPNSHSFAPGGGTKTSTVSVTPSTGTWSATEHMSWISVTASGANNGTLSITATENTTSSNRSGIVAVKLTGTSVTDTITVTQIGGPITIPATPQFATWLPPPHCKDAFELYGVHPVSWAANYQWRSSSSNVDIFPLGNGQSVNVNAPDNGSMVLHVKACNSAGCSAEGSKSVSVESCGGDGGPY